MSSEMKQIKDVEGSFDSSGWLFGLLLLNPRVITPFGEKEILAYFSKKSPTIKQTGEEELRKLAGAGATQRQGLLSYSFPAWKIP